MENQFNRNLFDQKLSVSQKILQALGKDEKEFPKAQPYNGRISPRDIYLYRVDEITYENKVPSREAMENILGTFRGIEGISFLYMILGDQNGVKFYLGLARDENSRENSLGLTIRDIANNLLERSIRGNFRGCRLTELTRENGWIKEKIMNKLAHPAYAGILTGVPSVEKSSQSPLKEQDSQGTDRLIDIMSGDEFGYVVIARPYTDAEIHAVAKDLYAISDFLLPLVKRSLSRNENRQNNTSETDIKSKGEQSGEGTNSSETENHSHTETKNDNETASQSSSRQNSQVKTGNTQTSSSEAENTSHEYSEMDNKERNSNSKNNGVTKVEGVSSGYQSTESNASTYSKSHTDGVNASDSRGYSQGTSKTTSHMCSSNHSSQTGSAQSSGDAWVYQLPLEQKEAADWVRYMDEVLFPRLDNGRGKGLFLSCVYLFTNDNRANLLQLANTAISLFSGTRGNRAALRFQEFPMNPDLGPEDGKTKQRMDSSCWNIWNALSQLQIPRRLTGKNDLDKALLTVQSCDGRALGDWLSSDELGLLMGFPQKEVIGLSVRKEVNFGLNVGKLPDEENRIELGKMVQCGEKKTPVYLDKKDLDKHTFIAGTTGSGKTTTCQNILLDSGMNFLVIEPVKSEYRILKEQCPDVIYFTPGNPKAAPFFLNPFELFPGEAISSRAEMLKASIEASFHMDAAIPQILESAIYKAYQEKGWDTDADTWNGKNENDADGPFAPYSNAFPTFSDFAEACRKEIESKGFDERLRDEYMGTINAMTGSLLMGAKGQMLDTPRSINFYDLVNHKVVIELDEIKTGSEKSLLMGFILTNLMAAVKARHGKAKKEGKEFRHITLVEEAHRLFSKYMPGDSLNKKQGVEVFADMLAEVRKYGESIIIVDQIPDKMTPEVLKNTNTKIVHKLFAQDDKETIGNTMALDKDQKAFLSNLPVGRAVVFSQGWTKAVQVQVEQKTNTTGQEVSDREIRDTALQFYTKKETLDRGVLVDLRIRPVTTEMVSSYFDLLRNKGRGVNELKRMLEGGPVTEHSLQELRKEILPYALLGADTIARVYWRELKKRNEKGRDRIEKRQLPVEKLRELMELFLQKRMNQAGNFLLFLNSKENVMENLRILLSDFNAGTIQKYYMENWSRLREGLLALIKCGIPLQECSEFVHGQIYDEAAMRKREGDDYIEDSKKELAKFLENIAIQNKTDVSILKDYRILFHNCHVNYIRAK